MAGEGVGYDVADDDVGDYDTADGELYPRSTKYQQSLQYSLNLTLVHLSGVGGAR